jgi:hypothetical protein
LLDAIVEEAVARRSLVADGVVIADAVTRINSGY